MLPIRERHRARSALAVFKHLSNLKRAGLIPFAALLCVSSVAAVEGTPAELQGYGLPGGDIYVGPPVPEGGMPENLLPGGNLPGPVLPEPQAASVAPIPEPVSPQQLLGPLTLEQPLADNIIPPELGLPDPSAIIDQLLNGIVPGNAGGEASASGLQPGDIVLTGSVTGQFAVTPTGAATYSIPISVPPGTAGMQPKLALSYSSQGGNGLLGMGWSLSGLSAITRCPATYAQDGFADGVNFNNNDRLCLDGQHLLAVDGTYGSSNTVYRTEVDGISKITAGTFMNAPNSTFTVQTKSGLIYHYGDLSFGENASFRTDPNGKIIYAWSVSRIQDTVGNYISVSYARDSQTNEYTVTRIDYSGNGFVVPRNSIQFFYDSSRSDVYERHLPGGSAKITANKRLSRIETWGDPGTGNAVKVREYRLDYEALSAPYRSRLGALTECAIDAGITYCLPSTTFTWQTKPKTFVANGGPALQDALTKDSGKNLSEVIDINGDGLPDQVTAFQESTGNITRATHINQGGSSFSNSGPFFPSVIYIEGERTGEFADVNGDGFADFVRSYSNSRHAYINNGGSGWNEDITYKPPRTIFGGDSNGELMDFNGDGLVDFALTTDPRFGTTNLVYINNPAPCTTESCRGAR